MQTTENTTTNVTDEDILAGMLAEMGGDEISDPLGEVPESTDGAIEAGAAANTTTDKPEGLDEDLAGIDGINDEMLIATVSELEATEVREQLYGEGDSETAPAPTTEGGKLKKAAKPKKEKKAANNKPTEPKEPRVTYVGHNASEVLQAKLGDKVGEMLILEAEDALLSPEDLAVKQRELLTLLSKRPGTGEGGSTQKKVAEKVVMLFGWIKNGGKLNEVMSRTFSLLNQDGFITSGEKGNLHQNLLSKPYSKGTANAQSGQMMAMLPMLKIATPDGKGKLSLNPNSVLFDVIKARMSL